MKNIEIVSALIFVVNASDFTQIEPTFYFERPPKENNRISISKELWSTDWNVFVYDRKIAKSEDLWFNLSYSGWSDF